MIFCGVVIFTVVCSMGSHSGRGDDNRSGGAVPGVRVGVAAPDPGFRALRESEQCWKKSRKGTYDAVRPGLDGAFVLADHSAFQYGHRRWERLPLRKERTFHMNE